MTITKITRGSVLFVRDAAVIDSCCDFIQSYDKPISMLMRFCWTPFSVWTFGNAIGCWKGPWCHHKIYHLHVQVYNRPDKEMYRSENAIKLQCRSNYNQTRRLKSLDVHKLVKSAVYHISIRFMKSLGFTSVIAKAEERICGQTERRSDRYMEEWRWQC